jgi:AcrR family transcriptional regulator
MPARSAKTNGGRTATIRRTQEERSSATRALLLNATIDCLIDLGYSATTTTVIAERAGVSRGAQLHHFPTKAELVAAAVEHLARKIGAEFTSELERLRTSDDQLMLGIDVLWARYESPLFEAWLELAVAARTDPELRASLTPVETRLRVAIQRMAADLLGDEPGSKGNIGHLVELTFHVLQGLAVERLLLTENRRTRERREAQALAAWKGVIADHLAARR